MIPDGTRHVPSDSLALVRAVEVDIAAFRAALPRVSEAEFLARLEELVRADRDPELYDAVWSFKEGKLDRSGLMRHPAYGRAIARRFDEIFEELTPEETQELHTLVDEIRDERSAEGDERDRIRSR